MEKSFIPDEQVLHLDDIQILNNISGYFILLGLAAISQFLSCAAEISVNSFGDLTLPVTVANAAVTSFLFVIGISGLSHRLTFKEMKHCRLGCGILAVICVLAILLTLFQVRNVLPVERIVLIGLYMIGSIVFTAVTYRIESRIETRLTGR